MSLMVISMLGTVQFRMRCFMWAFSFKYVLRTVYNFDYICPGIESNGYFYGMHSIGSDEVVHVISLIWLITVYNFTCTVNPLYNVSVCSQWFVTLKWICCYKESVVLDRQMSKHVPSKGIIPKYIFYVHVVDIHVHIIFFWILY